MADQLDMNGLSLNDSKHAPNGLATRSAYVPPHMRGRGAGPAPMDGPPDGNPGLAGSAWGNQGCVKTNTVKVPREISAF